MRCAHVADCPWRGGRPWSQRRVGWGRMQGYRKKRLSIQVVPRQRARISSGWEGGCGRDGETGDWRREGGRWDAGNCLFVVVLAWHVRMGAWMGVH